MGKSIGMLDKSTARYSASGVYGAFVAEKEFIKNLICYTTFDSLEFMNFKDLYHDMVVRRHARQSANTHIRSFDKMRLIQKDEMSNVDILHDTFGEFMKLIMLRDQFTVKKPPVTYIMHCTSIPEYTIDTYLMNCLFGFQNYDSLICTSDSMKRVVRYYVDSIQEKLNRLYNANACFKGRMDTIPLGVDTEKYHPMDRCECRWKLKIPQDAYVILYHGRINLYFKSDLFPLLTVIKHLRMKNSKKIILILSGEDDKQVPAYPYIKKYIARLGLEDNVVILNLENDNEILYNTADVFTSPIDNVQETFGITVIEAMACGIPQVVPDWDGYRETLVHKETGFLIPTYWADCTADISSYPFADKEGEFGHKALYSHFLMSQSTAIDLQAYEHAFQTLIDNPQLARCMAEVSVKRVNERYRWERIIKAYDSLWNELLFEQQRSVYCPSQANELFNNEYSKAFHSYPTRFIQETDMCKVTLDGEQFICSKEDFPLHFNRENIFPEYALSHDILCFLACESKVSVFDIIGHFVGTNSKERILRSLMYLIKHGYLTICINS